MVEYAEATEGPEGASMTPTKEQIEAVLDLANQVATALATARLEGRNAALDEVALKVRSLHFRSDIIVDVDDAAIIADEIIAMKELKK